MGPVNAIFRGYSQGRHSLVQLGHQLAQFRWRRFRVYTGDFGTLPKRQTVKTQSDFAGVDKIHCLPKARQVLFREIPDEY